MATTKNVTLGSSVLINWKSNTNSGVPTLDANHEASIYSEDVQVIDGHKYLIMVSASGFINYAANISCRYGIAVGSSNNYIATQEFGMERNGFTGFGSAPISLHGIYTAPANATVTVDFRFWSEAAAFNDWILNQDNHHTMIMLDLGP